MVLSQLDRIFLRDYVQMNWMHRYLAVQALAHGGGQIAGPLAEKALALWYPDKTFAERVQMAESGEKGRVQGIMLAKIFAEFVGALEDTGAFLRAIAARNSAGILPSHFRCKPADVKAFYERIRTTPGGTPRMLAFPPLAKLKLTDPAVLTDVRNFYAGSPKRIRQIASMYRKEFRRTVVKLNTGRPRKDRRHFVHVLVGLRTTPRAPLPPEQMPAGMFVKTYNKIKHGFNVLEDTGAYAKLPRRPYALEVVRASLVWGGVKAMIDNIGTMGLLCSRAAAVTLHLDDAGYA